MSSRVVSGHRGPFRLWNFQWVNGSRMGIDRATERERTERRREEWSEGEREEQGIVEVETETNN
jgi:hypothetical protein